jgi:MFS superfamily sulfate permease-like transporter
MLAVDFFHVDCALTLERLYCLFVIEVGSPLRWIVFDCAAIGDIDYTASAALTRVIEHLHRRRIRFTVSTIHGPVRQQLDRYGISAALGPGAYYDTPGEALEAYHAAKVIGDGRGPSANDN